MSGIQRQYLRVSDAAHFTGISVSLLNKLRCRGEGPRYIKHGRLVAYPVDGLIEFMEAGSIETTNWVDG
jgi:predicted DNA-binding transcriptional regulator AlpA